ncbi:acyltransferase family protein [Aquibacillus rhizosphaerae]|uniref:Acyltransferase family protein n=1 Tax=Aquibacillus rhizosphaerae TaxID=3051431 RepID=A0ABT7KZF5_9BACI|nr:acyltransferase family protein [Aquibacillus sp. LR5S19]MDL4838901.1 acyltransferase family protein [Aquibacillus sp. LR5S19]
MSDLRIPEKRFRPEIEGIRAVAAFLVAIYHIWLGSVSGGVDVFFIVSGYLITVSLLSKMEKHGRINYGEYVLGLARRLFPIAFLVLLVTTLLSILIMPRTLARQIVTEIFSSTFYFQNWQLANNAVDYLAQNNEASPLQHFWALSLQGQFYVTWPLVVFIAFLIAKKVLKTPARKTLLGVLSFIFITSISYSIYITAENQPWAYFDTFARAWEFSLGGIFALLTPYLKFNKAISLIIGWLGLSIVAFTGILLPVSNVFPGYAALLPTSGVILVLIAAENGSRFSVDKLLGSKPFLYFGGISYAFYLWHWPLLILYYNYSGNDSASTLAGVVIIVIAFILSLISVRLVESPIRKINLKQSKLKLITILIAFMLSVVIVNGSWGLYSNQTEDVFSPVYDYEEDNYPGARAIYENINNIPDVEPISEEPGATSSLPAFYLEKDCYSDLKGNVVSLCSYGETDDPEHTIALVGGSHSGHWFPALMEMSEELELQIDVYNKDGCRFTANDFDGAMSDSCMEWNEKVIEPLKENPPDLLFTTANVNKDSKIPEGYLEMWREFEGITEIFAIRDNPRMKEKIPLCLETKSEEECSVPRDEAISDTPPWENTDNIPSNVTFADLSDYLCDDNSCYPVIGNVVVYRDQHHLNTLYSKTMAPALKEHIAKALEKTEK